MIKKVFHAIVLTLLTTSVNAQGISFIEEDWNLAVSKAKQENKLIFLDAYTTWCGPCKMLATRIFPLEEVGTFFNKNYINVKVDMEKGQGIELANQYSVRAYPTLLFIDPSGEVVHTIIGAVNQKVLLEAGQKALDPSSNNKGIKEQYLADPTNDKLTLKYINTLIESYDPQLTEVGLNYLKRQTNWFEMNNEELIVELIQVEDPTARTYILQNWSQYQANKQHFSKEFQDDFPFQLASMEYFFNQNQYQSRESFDQMALKVAGSQNNKTYDALVAFYLAENNQSDALVAHYKKMLKKYKDQDEHTSIARNLGEKGGSAKAYKLGLKTINKVLKKDPKNASARYAKVVLLHYSGKVDEAVKLYEELEKELN